MNLAQFKKLKIPETPGVYSFKKDGQVLYIGKATSLRERLRSYFSPDLIQTRGRRIVNMVAVADVIEFETADSVLEAFIRETELIKKYQPIANSLAKDNKSFNYVVITDEEFPRVLVARGRNLEKEDIEYNYKYIFGPYPFGAELREALRIIRRIFPFRDTCMPADELPKGQKPKPCFNYSLGLCPGVCAGTIARSEYLKIINNIRLFFSGKKSKVMDNLRKQMMIHAKKQEFEAAGEIKKTLFSLEHIKDISLIKRESEDKLLRQNKEVRDSTNINKEENDSDLADSDSTKIPSDLTDLQDDTDLDITPRYITRDWEGELAEKQIRIESYDIAHMSGKDMVGVMCVMTDGELDRSQYRKFIIKDIKASNDTGALSQVLERRLGHTEWKWPDIIVVDGGQGQLNAVFETVQKHHQYLTDEYPELEQMPMPYIVGVVKDDAHKAREILYTSPDEILIKNVSNLATKEQLIALNAETHRFAITFHKKKRGESFLPKTKNQAKSKNTNKKA